MPKTITSHALKTQLDRILREPRGAKRFVILRRNLRIAVLISIRDYVKEHPDQYEDVDDFMNTLLEEGDPEFQRSLRRGAREIKQGRYLSHTGLKLALANKKLR